MYKLIHAPDWLFIPASLHCCDPINCFTPNVTCIMKCRTLLVFNCKDHKSTAMFLYVVLSPVAYGRVAFTAATTENIQSWQRTKLLMWGRTDTAGVRRSPELWFCTFCSPCAIHATFSQHWCEIPHAEISSSEVRISWATLHEKRTLYFTSSCSRYVGFEFKQFAWHLLSSQCPVPII